MGREMLIGEARLPSRQAEQVLPQCPHCPCGEDACFPLLFPILDDRRPFMALLVMLDDDLRFLFCDFLNPCYHHRSYYYYCYWLILIPRIYVPGFFQALYVEFTDLNFNIPLNLV